MAFGDLFKFYLQHQLEFGVSVIVVPSVLYVFATPLISVDFSTIRDISQDPIESIVSLFDAIRRNSNSHEPCKYKKTKDDCMASVVLRLVFARIDECWCMDQHITLQLGIGIRLTGNKTTTVRNSQLHCRRGSSFIMPSGVVRIPHQDARDAAIHSCGHKESHSVFNLGRANVGYHSISNNSYWQSEEHDDTSKSQSIGNERYNYWLLVCINDL